LVADACGAEPVKDAAALIRSDTVDAIDVCLPSAIHNRFVVAALSEAKHVFCETPVVLRLDEARQMRDAARRARRPLQVGLLMRSVARCVFTRRSSATNERRLGRLENKKSDPT